MRTKQDVNSGAAARRPRRLLAICAWERCRMTPAKRESAAERGGAGLEGRRFCYLGFISRETVCPSGVPASGFHKGSDSLLSAKDSLVSVMHSGGF